MGPIAARSRRRPLPGVGLEEIVGIEQMEPRAAIPGIDRAGRARRPARPARVLQRRPGLADPCVADNDDAISPCPPQAEARAPGKRGDLGGMSRRPVGQIAERSDSITDSGHESQRMSVRADRATRARWVLVPWTKIGSAPAMTMSRAPTPGGAWTISRPSLSTATS